MKKLILSAALGLACVSALAQGTLNFANAGSGVNAKVFDASGNGIGGTGYMADLFWAAGNVTDADSLAALAAPSTFSTIASQAGYFFGGARTVNGALGGSTITVQVRAWNAVAGATWDDALAYAKVHNTEALVGMSDLFQVQLTTAPATPVNLTGLTSFNLVAVPEPTTLALAGLGAAALLIFRRRK